MLDSPEQQAAGTSIGSSRPSGCSRSAHRDCQVTSFQALCTALQHPAVTADPQTVCCVLQTCRSWRAAVQQAAAGTTIIDLHSLHSIAKLSQFAAWIPRHAGMLAELFLTVPQSGCEGLSAESYATAAEQVLLLALQNTAAAAGAHAVFPASPASPRPAVLQPLRLRVFSTDFLSGPGLLAALPAATLTSLGVKHMQGYPSANSTAISHALAGLTALRHLTLENYNCEHGKLAGNCLQGVAKLACLTSLRLTWVAADADLALLPQTLQELRLAACCGAAPLKLQHLTGVEALHLDLQGTPAPGSALPAQLQQLTLYTWGDNVAADTFGNSSYLRYKQHNLQHLQLDALQQLRALVVTNGLCEPQQMHRVACLPKLEAVVLRYTDASLAQRAAPAWPHLQQLRELTIEGGSCTPTLDELDTKEFMQQIGAATTLVALHIASSMVDGDVHICRYLTGLQQLQDLNLTNAEGPNTREDALHLTALTGLTALVLDGAQGVDDVAAVAIASWLRQLQNLELRSCGLTTAAALPAIGSLTQLQYLCLTGYGATEIEGGDIMLLTRLTKLVDCDAVGIHADFSDTFDHEAVSAFYQALAGLGSDTP
ncbi:hypothetical protein OEZ86_012090 [Tetradesmus obliquus]|nr:hypothetical protein OEZ86_012090 [Tetradesmus obliquus]